MQLQDLKLGQQFRFTTGTNQTTYRIIREYPQLKYTAVNGIIEYSPTYKSRLLREVTILNADVLPIEIYFRDVDGDQIKVSTETEANFVHVLVIPADRPSAIAALDRKQVIELIDFLQRHLQIKG